MLSVVLTTDVESYTGDYEREVFGDGLGLDFILGACAVYGVRTTFFVEALGVTRWGPGPTREIVASIARGGHEIGLHVHPSVARIEGFHDRRDVLWEQDAATQTMLLERGRECLGDCGAPAVSTFRAGDFAADARTLDAMAGARFRVGSNRDLDLKSSIRSRLNDAFSIGNDLSERDGIKDLPVTALRSPFPRLDGPYRHMEISAMGLREMCDGLARMACSGYVCAGILTHPREFFRYAGERAAPIVKNRRRLEGLLRFVNESDGMELTTLAECAAAREPPPSQPPLIRARPLWSLSRLLQQGLDRLKAPGVFNSRFSD